MGLHRFTKKLLKNSARRKQITFVVIESVPFPGLQIYGGPGSLSHDFKIRPITFQGSGPSGLILFSCEKISL